MTDYTNIHNGKTDFTSTDKENGKEYSLWLFCYKYVLKSEPWWRSDKKIKELALIMTLEILQERIQILEKSHNPTTP